MLSRFTSKLSGAPDAMDCGRAAVGANSVSPKLNELEVPSAFELTAAKFRASWPVGPDETLDFFFPQALTAERAVSKIIPVAEKMVSPFDSEAGLTRIFI